MCLSIYIVLVLLFVLVLVLFIVILLHFDSVLVLVIVTKISLSTAILLYALLVYYDDDDDDAGLSSGAEMNLKVGGTFQARSAVKIFVVPLHFSGFTSTISHNLQGSVRLHERQLILT